jgi:hypothetical protein
MNQRLCHDVSWQVTTSVIQMFAPLLPETEQAEAFAQVYARVKVGIEIMEIQSARMAQRRGRAGIRADLIQCLKSDWRGNTCSRLPTNTTTL